MAYLDSIPEPWRSFLRELDEAVGEKVRLVCMGGFVVTQTLRIFPIHGGH